MKRSFPPIADLVPHAGPMVLLDEVLAWDEPRIVCGARIRPGMIFAEGDFAPGTVVLEYMAQTAAAYAGLQARITGDVVRNGYLLGTRELILHVDQLAVGDDLTIEAERLWGDELLGSFRCTVTRDAKTVASAVLSVYQGALPEEIR